MSTDKKTTLKQKLTQARTDLENLLASLTPEQWHTPVISEGNTWTALDIVAHLVENERGMSIHVHKIRKGQETVPPDFNLNQWNAGLKGRMGHPSPEELLANMVQTRTRTLEGLESIRDEEWDLTGRHPARGVITIAQYYETMAGHDAWHTGDIKKALGLKN
ncbi:MAG: DinB family protein [Chloroflexi bacterium]|nr:DinB family protein [Chloroflexota bacterium]